MIGPDLNKICNGHLKQEFLRYLPEVMAACDETGKSGRIVFTLTIAPTPVTRAGEMVIAYAFHSKVRAIMPSRQGMDIYGWENGELTDGDATMQLPFQDTAEAGNA